MAVPTRVALGVAAALVAGAGGIAAWQLLGSDGGDRRAAEAFANSWVEGNLDDLRWERGSGSDPAARVAAVTAGLTPSPDDRPR